jgi:hypothetical protein
MENIRFCGNLIGLFTSASMIYSFMIGKFYLKFPDNVQCYQNREGTINMRGHAVAQLAEALRYKPEGRGIDSR